MMKLIQDSSDDGQTERTCTLWAVKQIAYGKRECGCARRTNRVRAAFRIA